MIFIAEAGLNHNGNFDLCYELIKQAKYAGADIVKFQLGWRAGEGEMNRINEDLLAKLNQWANYFEIELLFSIFTPTAYEMAKKFNFKRYKIASRTVMDDINLVRQIISEGKETFVSLGMWKEATPPIADAPNIKYLWCKSKYPTTPWDLTDLPKTFTNTIYSGYSDHSIGIETAIIAITRGAKVVEKHFTLDKSNVTIRDHALSSTPDEFLQMTRIGRDIARKLEIGV